MSSFRDVSTNFSASAQISVQDVELAAKEGFTAIICNRPDNEDAGQINAAEIDTACTAHGLSFTHIPVVGGMTEAQVEMMRSALERSVGPVLAYCRSGTRSTNIWALSQATNGEEPNALVDAARDAGYDLSGLLPTLQALASR